MFSQLKKMTTFRPNQLTFRAQTVTVGSHTLACINFLGCIPSQGPPAVNNDAFSKKKNTGSACVRVPERNVLETMLERLPPSS